VTYPMQPQPDQGDRGGFAGYVEAPRSGYPYVGGRPYVPQQGWQASGPRPYVPTSSPGSAESYGRHAHQAPSSVPAAYPGQYGFRRRASYGAPARYSTPPAYSAPARHSTPPAYSAPARHSTPPAYSAAPRHSAPPAYSAPARHSTPPAYSAPARPTTPARASTPPAYSAPARHSTPPAYSGQPAYSAPRGYPGPQAYSAPPSYPDSLTDSGFQRRQSGYPGSVTDSGFQRRQSGYVGSVTDSGFQRRHSGYQDSLTDSGLQRGAGWAQNAHTSGNLRRYLGEEDFPTASPPIEHGSNGYAVAAFLFGLFGGWLAFVLGPLGIRRANETGRGKGLAVSGLILGLLWLPVQGVVAYQKFAASPAKHTTAITAPTVPAAPSDPGCAAATAAATKWNTKTNNDIAANNTKAVVADFRGYAADLAAAQKKSQNTAAVAAMKAYAADMTNLANAFGKGTAPDQAVMARLGSDGTTIARACAG
jgi:hypothetical protein